MARGEDRIANKIAATSHKMIAMSSSAAALLSLASSSRNFFPWAQDGMNVALNVDWMTSSGQLKAVFKQRFIKSGWEIVLPLSCEQKFIEPEKIVQIDGICQQKYNSAKESIFNLLADFHESRAFLLCQAGGNHA